MRNIREMLRRTRSSFSRILGGVNGRIDSIEATITAQGQRLENLETKKNTELDGLEVKEHIRKEVEQDRRDNLSDGDLKLDLEKQYGTTRWAKRLIAKVLHERTMMV